MSGQPETPGTTAAPAEVPGLAAERTALAWRRSLLSFTAACLVAGQTLPGVDGFRTLALAAAVALALTPPGWWFARRHARHTERHLSAPVPRLRHGRRIAIICGATSLLGIGGLSLVVGL